jgi:B12-binding domain/radical SAM domain protein
MAELSLVLRYRRTAKGGLDALVGALEVHPDLAATPVHLGRTLAETIAAAREVLAAGRRPVVLWSFLSPGFVEVAEELAAFRAAVPHGVLHVAGGVHTSAEPEGTLRAGFDLAAIGEGERIVQDLVLALASGGDPGAVRGIARLEGGRLVKNGRGEPIDLDAFPSFAPAHRRFGAIEITRGCIYACKFCQTPYMAKARFRHRSVASACEHARWIRAAGLRDVRVLTPTALSYGATGGEVRLEAVDELLGRLRETVGPDGRLFFGTFPSELRPEHVSALALRVLKKWVDNDNLIVGGQSGSDRLLGETHRGHDAACIERAVRLCVEGGFLPQVDFLFGLPGETPDDAAASRALMARLADLGARVHAHTFLPLPGTPLAGAGPGVVDGATLRDLERLASSGRAYGQWKRQAEVAKRLAGTDGDGDGN